MNEKHDYDKLNARNAAIYARYFGDRAVDEQAELFPTRQSMIDYVLDPTTEHQPTSVDAKRLLAERMWAYIRDNRAEGKQCQEHA